MKTQFISFASSLTLTILSVLSAQRPALAQGSLTPPGPPGPTMKTLQQIEPRTPIPSLPTTITTPGSYYLTSNATLTGTAIQLQSSNITVDLNGFTLTGDGGDVDYGIWSNPTTRVANITIRNGKFQNFAAAVVIGGEGADNVLVENIQMSTSTRAGIWLDDCNGAVIRDNVLVNCDAAIYVTSFNGDYIRGITIANNRVSGGDTEGIRLHGQDGVIRDVSILNNQIAGTAGSAVSVSTFGTGTVSRLWIDSNHFTKTNGTLGIIIPTNTAATIVRNVFTGCTLSIATNGNTIGPVINTLGTLGTNGAAMSPWANFQN